jgi:hypothetical protein
MAANIWQKYLPVLRIILKRSLNGEQQFALNETDFERAGYRRKPGNKFELELKDRRLSNVLVNSPIGSSLATTLLEDAAVRELTDGNSFRISMNTRFQLTIKHTPAEEVSPAG